MNKDETREQTKTNAVTWEKPFSNREKELAQIKDRYDAAPKETKELFARAYTGLRDKVEREGVIANAIHGTRMRLHVFHDLHFSIDDEPVHVDFCLISDDTIVLIDAYEEAPLDTPRFDRRFAKLPDFPSPQRLENNAYLIAELLHRGGFLGRKEMIRVTPLLVDTKQQLNDKNILAESRSLLYNEIKATSVLSIMGLGEWLCSNMGENPRGKPFFNEKKLPKICEYLISHISK
ncbi:MAG TPA: hypothetical protein PKV44_05855 [Bacillota bacterium]|nr:hypothetical protein [Bacillota bacterium]HPE37963.1 hypothetical protein [Bacillota bacterium]